MNARRRPRVELLYDATPVHLLIADLDAEQCRDALRTIALWAAANVDGPPLTASAALWAALAGAVGAPVLAVGTQRAVLAATRSAVAARRGAGAR